ncbi:MAG: hypothetical protein RLZZ511_886 [Cyanobacteriota bacterium]|jgi:hypothetical protein
MQTLSLTLALKEWAIAVDALAAGEMWLLLRKGGLRDRVLTLDWPIGQSFLLYPTYEHQRGELLRSPYDQAVSVVASGWHPTTVSLGAIAQITDVLPLHDPAQVDALWPHHIWNQKFVADRWQWQPQRPFSVLCLRVWRAATPQLVVHQSHYNGCRSWLDLDQAVTLTALSPAIADAAYHAQVAELRGCLGMDAAPRPDGTSIDH